ncbi:hypothetical protein E4631_07160 [Hymenobacter sp. UV11]|uniref:hypothetical protein n=1 Tax=Hymenobacter sp. UV11 TaxID=1849735 RepID=UPI00105B40BD|nr:hypothetical protein [Hymenobacter sp. UV11]TDN37140.1 hypothetical protein A8B98_05275 [Hymenobacter sp. UV11]TFZ67740.1 hypothetical protein E4631_07160 [Hymenobacter sp. UV11]
MLRSLLTWLLLLNYLLVVGVGLLVSRPPEPLFTAAHPYVHSKECQQRNYLRLDCFERCNGDQHEVHRKLPTGTGLHYLAQLKGLDVHCAALPLAALPTLVGGWLAPPRGALALARLPPGASGRDYPPPQRG